MGSEQVMKSKTLQAIWWRFSLCFNIILNTKKHSCNYSHLEIQLCVVWYKFIDFVECSVLFCSILREYRTQLDGKRVQNICVDWYETTEFRISRKQTSS